VINSIVEIKHAIIDQHHRDRCGDRFAQRGNAEDPIEA
jgi:hypothetical protein